MPDITITLDEKTWAQLCLLARDREPALTPEALAKKFVIQDVVNFTRAKALGDPFVLEPEAQEQQEEAVDWINKEVEKRMDLE